MARSYVAMLALALLAMLSCGATAFDLSKGPSIFGSTIATFVDTTNNIFLAEFDLAPNSAINFHTHNFPEIFYVVSGKITVGTIDASASPPKVVTADLVAGQGFTFPTGVPHFQVNKSSKKAVATAAFGTANPGIQFLAPAVQALPNSYLKALYANGDAPSNPNSQLFFVAK